MKKSYARARTLGEGSFGCVCVVYDEETGQERAGKIFDANEDYDDASQETLREISVLRALQEAKHPNIIADCDFSITLASVSTLYMTMPLALGDLSSVLSWITSKQKLYILHGVCQGTAFLHACNVMHRDIKPENILLYQEESKYQPRIIDFSLCRWVSKLDMDEESVTTLRQKSKKRKSNKATKQREESEQTTSLCGTPTYIAPELVYGEQYTEKCDVYSVGVVAYELLTGGRLEMDKDKAAIKFIASKRENLNKTKPLPLLLYNMLAIKEADRPTAQECVETECLASAGEPIKCHCIPINPHKTFKQTESLRTGEHSAVWTQIAKYGRELDYTIVPTCVAAFHYSLVLPQYDVCYALQFSAKLFEPVTFDLDDLAEIIDSYNPDLQAPYEMKLLELIDYNPLHLGNAA